MSAMTQLDLISAVRQLEVVSAATIGVGTGAYLVQRGLWYQGKQKGFWTRFGSIAIGLSMFLIGVLLANATLS